MVFPSPYLSKFSDVEDFKQFLGKRAEHLHGSRLVNDWWIKDFTFEELKELKAVKNIGHFEHFYRIPKLEDMAELFIKFLDHPLWKKNYGFNLMLKDIELYELENVKSIFNEMFEGFDVDFDTLKENLKVKSDNGELLKFFKEKFPFKTIHIAKANRVLAMKISSSRQAKINRAIDEGLGELESKLNRIKKSEFKGRSRGLWSKILKFLRKLLRHIKWTKKNAGKII